MSFRKLARSANYNLFRALICDYVREGNKRGFKLDEYSEVNPAIDNEGDAFRHTFTAAMLTCRLYFTMEKFTNTQDQPGALRTAEVIADFCGYARKKKLSPNAYKIGANMDLWNEDIGRFIATDLIKNNKITKDNYSPRNKEMVKLVADEVAKYIAEGKTINQVPDPKNRVYHSRFDGFPTEESLLKAMQTSSDTEYKITTPSTLSICKTALSAVSEAFASRTSSLG